MKSALVIAAAIVVALALIGPASAGEQSLLRSHQARTRAGARASIRMRLQSMLEQLKEIKVLNEEEATKFRDDITTEINRVKDNGFDISRALDILKRFKEKMSKIVHVEENTMQCPEGYTASPKGNKCMSEISSSPKDWHHAAMDCAKQGGHVATHAEYAEFCHFSAGFGGDGSFDPFVGHCSSPTSGDPNGWLGDAGGDDNMYKTLNNCRCDQRGGFNMDGGAVNGHAGQNTRLYKCVITLGEPSRCREGWISSKYGGICVSPVVFLRIPF